MIFGWFDILEIVQLPKTAHVDADQTSGDWKTLSLTYIVTIKVILDNEHLIRVDAIPLLYELILASSSLTTQRLVDIEVGEGWRLKADLVSEGSLKLNFEFVVGSEIDRLSQYEMTSDALAVFLATRISKLVEMLEANGADVLSTLEQFPTALYKR
jgi:hypothetical protein